MRKEEMDIESSRLKEELKKKIIKIKSVARAHESIWTARE